ncbi:MAG: hypothetical protein KGY80_09530 [Candidatus Thorarchaeota archaeon]|nr:hypothetical protein [Candidatus Thorarchaeota archaeon]
MLYRMGFVTGAKESKAFTAVDTRKLNRVVISQNGNDEYVISGPPETTFGEVCLRHWAFDNVEKDSDWANENPQGNDITEVPRSEQEENARIVSTQGAESSENILEQKVLESTDKYTDGVSFFWHGKTQATGTSVVLHR